MMNRTLEIHPQKGILQIDLKAVSTDVNITFIKEFLKKHIAKVIHHCNQLKYVIEKLKI